MNLKPPAQMTDEELENHIANNRSSSSANDDDKSWAKSDDKKDDAGTSGDDDGSKKSDDKKDDAGTSGDDDGSKKSDDKEDKKDGENQDDGDDKDDDKKDSTDDKGAKEDKTPKSIQKLLEKRKEDRTKISSLEGQITEMTQKIKDLEAKKDATLTDEQRAEALIDAKMDQKLLQRDLQLKQELAEEGRGKEFNSFMKQHPELAQHREDFEQAHKNNPNLSLEHIHLIWLKENNPDAIAWLVWQKKESYGLAWKSSSGATKSDASKMTDAELESHINSAVKAGELKF